MRQIGDAQHFAEYQFADVGFDGARNVARQALDFHFTQNLLQNAALLFHSGSLALEHDRHTDLELLVHSDALEVDVQQMALDGLVLPVHDHGLGALAAFEVEVENSVVASLGVQNARHLAGIESHRQRFLARAIDDAGNFAALRTRRATFLLPGVRVCASRTLLSVAVAIIFHSYKNNLLTDVSS